MSGMAVPAGSIRSWIGAPLTRTVSISPIATTRSVGAAATARARNIIMEISGAAAWSARGVPAQGGARLVFRFDPTPARACTEAGQADCGRRSCAACSRRRQTAVGDEPQDRMKLRRGSHRRSISYCAPQGNRRDGPNGTLRLCSMAREPDAHGDRRRLPWLRRSARPVTP